MKKKFLLAIIPALLALSSCAAGASKAKNDIFLEDTLAHEEIFGDVEEVGYVKTLTPLKDPDPVNPLEEPTIGVQYQPRYEKVADSGEWYYSIRFVAAITSLSVDAQWTRGVSNTTSDQLKPVGTSASLIATTAYERVNDNGVITAASSIALKKPGEPDSYPYNYFVVYTLRDIPETYADCFAVAYLTLSDGVGTTVSKAVAARIAGDHEFSFAANKSAGFFMAGTIDGEEETVVDLDDEHGDNKCQKNDQHFEANDVFGIFLTGVDGTGYLNSFQYYGHTTFKNDSNIYYQRDDGSELFKVKYGGQFDVYLNGEWKVWLGIDSGDMTLYVKIHNDWKASTPKFSVHYIADGSFNALTKIDDDYYKLEHYDYTKTGLIFVRHNAGVDGYSWGNKWNQTSDQTYSLGSNNLFKITGGSGDTYYGSWATYPEV